MVNGCIIELCTVYVVLGIVATGCVHIAGHGRTAVHLQDQVLMLLHFVAHQGKYGLLSDRFGLTRSCYHRCVDDLLDIIVNQALKKFISWPDVHRQKETADYFQSKFGFPGVVGSIDGTHITIARPPGQFFPADYFSVRKKIYTMLLQVCTSKNLDPPPPHTHTQLKIQFLRSSVFYCKILDPPHIHTQLKCYVRSVCAILLAADCVGGPHYLIN